MILKNVCPSPVSSRVESYEGRDRVLRPPHRHRLLRRLQRWMWAAVSPAAGSSGGWPHPLQHPDVLWVREYTHHFLFLFHDSNCFIIVFFFNHIAMRPCQSCGIWSSVQMRQTVAIISELRGCWLESSNEVSCLQSSIAKQTHLFLDLWLGKMYIFRIYFPIV